MATKLRMLRQALNKNYGLIGLIFLLAGFFGYQELANCFKLWGTPCDFIILVMVIYGGCACSLAAVAEAIFEKRY